MRAFGLSALDSRLDDVARLLDASHHNACGDWRAIPWLITKATTFTKQASFPERTHRALTGRAEIRFEWCGPPSLTLEAAKV